LHNHADDLDQLVTVESLRAERVDAEHAAWLSAENALHEANGSVESLRAEQDKVVAQFEMVLVERNKAREDVEYWREQFRLVCDESEDHKKQADEARARHATVSQERDGLRGVLAAAAAHAHAEAAWERCRKPRVWQRGDSVPDVATRVRDKQGDVWNWRGGGWTCRRDSVVGGADWETVLIFAPLTEVLDED